MEISTHANVSEDLLHQAVSLIIREMAEMGITPTEALDPDLSDLAIYYTQHGSMWLAHEQGMLLGTCAVRVDPGDPPTGELRRFYVALEQRGQGIGKALLACALDFSQQRGLSRLCAHTKKDNASLGYYSQWGFKTIPLAEEVRDKERENTVCLSLDM